MGQQASRETPTSRLRAGRCGSVNPSGCWEQLPVAQLTALWSCICSSFMVSSGRYHRGPAVRGRAHIPDSSARAS